MNRAPRAALAVALALPTLASALGFSRVFVGTSFIGPVLIVAIASHAAAALTRKLPTLLAEPAHLLLGVLVTCWVVLPQTVAFGLPSSRTRHEAHAALTVAWHSFATESAPVSPRTGYVLVACVALWLIGWVADRLVFKLGTPVEALIPSATVFVFVTLLSGPHHRLSSTIGFGVAVALFALTWRTVHRPRRHAFAALSGVALIATSLLAGVLLLDTVPGARGAGAVEVRRLGRQSSDRTVVSPLVDIRRRLLDQSDQELLRVRAAEPSYWRLMALDQFDGTVWSSNEHFEDVHTRLQPDQRLPAGGHLLRQRYVISGLDQPWVPAAFQASSVPEGDDHLQWDPQTATLIVDRSRHSASGLTYTVDSLVKDWTPAELRAASGPIPRSIASKDLALPTAFPGEISRIAAAVTEGGTTTYDRARALQDWFRSTFRYSTDVAPGQSSQAILEFLHDRVGYCEQFAGTYAAMARSLGIPARVVVGFTPGTPDPDDPTSFTVRGRNAHAWPEVYIGGAGWVSFEPTPGRGNPQASQHTGVSPEQAGPGPQPVPSPTVPPTTTASTDSTQSPTVPTSSPPSTPPTIPSSRPLTTAPTASQHSSGWGRAGAALACLLLLLAACHLVVRARRARRHHRARTPAATVLAWWRDVLDAASLVGLPATATATHLELAHAIGNVAPAVVEPDIRALGTLATRAAWAPSGISAGEVEDARRAAHQTIVALRRVIGRGARLRSLFDPRTRWRPVAPARATAGYSSWWKRSRNRS